MSGVPYRGVSSDQDVRFLNKEKSLLKRLKFPPNFSQKVNLKRVNWESIKPWICKRITELLDGVEDDVVIQYVLEQTVDKKNIDPRMLQINITGFLEDKAPVFVQELWSLLLSAAETPSGVPQSFLDAAAADLKRHREQQEELQRRLRDESRLKDSSYEYNYDERSRNRDLDHIGYERGSNRSASPSSRRDRRRKTIEKRGRSKSRDRNTDRSKRRCRGSSSDSRSRSRLRGYRRDEYRERSYSRMRDREIEKASKGNRTRRRARSTSRSLSS